MMNDQRGTMNVLLIPLILVVLLLIGAIGFGAWAFSERQDYKNNTDTKITAAVEVAKQQTASEKDNEFLEKEKEPLKEYVGSDVVGTLALKYPKTWSAYIEEKEASNTPLDGYFHPNYVPASGDEIAYALRVQVISSSYESEVKQLENEAKKGSISVEPYQATNVTSVLGLRVDGEISKGKQGSMVLLPLRDKTIKIWTESEHFINDFDEIILENLNFIP